VRKLPIGVRLTLWYVAIFAVSELIFATGMWLILRQNLYGIADDSLKVQVEDLTSFLQAQKTNATVAKLQEEVSEAYVLEHAGDYLQIYHGHGEWIYRAPFMERNAVHSVEPGAERASVYQNLNLREKPFRFLQRQIEVNGRTYSVQTGVPADQILKTLSLFRRYLLLLAPTLLLAAAAGGYWLSLRALSPVDAITMTARNISGTNLSGRLEKLATGDELQRLSDTLNEMLDRLEDAFRRVAQFTADASHELRTPISLIRTESEIALRRSRSAEEYRTVLHHILLEAERTTSLVEELLSLARADAGRETLRTEMLDLRAAVSEVAKEWRQLVELRNLEFRQSTAGDHLLVLADPAAILRVVAILLDNAVKYTPSPGIIELCAELRGDKAIIVVRDSGIGITQEDQSRIFERFYCVNKARSRELGGAGLGLAIAKWIVQQHHGTISVHSVPGKGSTFTVELQHQPSQVSRETMHGTVSAW
jgi:two-component system, OmpR family, heavy metal sensor histidine kinase CusS